MAHKRTLSEASGDILLDADEAAGAGTSDPQAVRSSISAHSAKLARHSVHAESIAAAKKLADGIEKERATLRAKYGRGKPVRLEKLGDKRERTRLSHVEARLASATETAASAAALLHTEQAGFIELDGPLERHFKIKQSALRDAVPVQAAAKSFELSLSRGPYNVDFTSAGRHLLLGGRSGHVALMDWLRGELLTELHLGETVRDVRFLHDHTMFATAQRDYVYIYDKQGTELHCLRNMHEPTRLEYLPHHFLLCAVSATGVLRYLDTSTGTDVASAPSKLGKCDVMRANPRNAIVHLGHANGTVTLWAPSSNKPLVKMLVNKGPVTALAFDVGGNVLFTAGLDRSIHAWDSRTYRELYGFTLPKPATTLDVSQRGVLAAGWGSHVFTWRNAPVGHEADAYLTHLQPASPVRDVLFVPFEDVLGVGHEKGYTSLLVPGAGEPNLDTFAANKYQTLKQRREAEVKLLLDKIPAEMIALDEAAVGSLRRAPSERERLVAKAAARAARELKAKHKASARPRADAQSVEDADAASDVGSSTGESDDSGGVAAAVAAAKAKDPKFKMRGRSKGVKKYLRKKHNVVTAKTVALRAELADLERLRSLGGATNGQAGGEAGAVGASAGGSRTGTAAVLDRFRKRPAASS